MGSLKKKFCFQLRVKFDTILQFIEGSFSQNTNQSISKVKVVSFDKRMNDWEITNICYIRQLRRTKLVRTRPY